MKAPSPAAREAAEMLAIQALGFIAAEPERLDAFLAATGLTLERLRESATEPDFLAGVLEHMLADESSLARLRRERRHRPGRRWRGPATRSAAIGNAIYREDVR